MKLILRFNVTPSLPAATGSKAGALPVNLRAVKPTHRAVRRFTCTEGRHNKFWEVSVTDSILRVRYGAIGTMGQNYERDCGSNVEANRERMKMIRQKLAKGYKEVA